MSFNPFEAAGSINQEYHLKDFQEKLQQFKLNVTPKQQISAVSVLMNDINSALKNLDDTIQITRESFRYVIKPLPELDNGNEELSGTGSPLVGDLTKILARINSCKDYLEMINEHSTVK